MAARAQRPAPYRRKNEGMEDAECQLVAEVNAVFEGALEWIILAKGGDDIMLALHMFVTRHVARLERAEGISEEQEEEVKKINAHSAFTPTDIMTKLGPVLVFLAKAVVNAHTAPGCVPRFILAEIERVMSDPKLKRDIWMKSVN